MPSNLPIKPRNFCKNFCTNYGLLNIKKGLFLIQLFLTPIPVITGAFGHSAIQDFFNKNEMEIQFLGCFISHIKNDRTHSDMKCQFMTSSSRTRLSVHTAQACNSDQSFTGNCKRLCSTHCIL